MEAYPPEQCTRRRWNAEKLKWERAFGNCMICSCMCPAREKEFEQLGKKRHFDTTTGMLYWK